MHKFKKGDKAEKKRNIQSTHTVFGRLQIILTYERILFKEILKKGILL